MTDSSPDSQQLQAPRRGATEFALALHARLGCYLKRAEQALMTQKSEALRPFDLTVAQYAALMALYFVPGQSSAQLSRVESVKPQTMATVLAKLEEKGLIQRVPSSVHAKVLVTTLTPAGEELVLKADEQARAVEQRLADAFNQAEHQQIRALLERAVAALQGSELDPQ